MGQCNSFSDAQYVSASPVVLWKKIIKKRKEKGMDFLRPTKTEWLGRGICKAKEWKQVLVIRYDKCVYYFVYVKNALRRVEVFFSSSFLFFILEKSRTVSLTSKQPLLCTLQQGSSITLGRESDKNYESMEGPYINLISIFSKHIN